MWAEGMGSAYMRGIGAAKKDLEDDEDRLEEMAKYEKFEGCFRQGYGHIMSLWKKGSRIC